MSEQDERQSYDALNRQLQQLRHAAARERAALEEQLEQVRRQRGELERRAGEERRRSPDGGGGDDHGEEIGLLPKRVRVALQYMMIMGAIVVPLLGQCAVIDEFVVPWRCTRRCEGQKLRYVSQVRRGGDGRGAHAVVGCLCVGHSDGARCEGNPRPGVHLCKDPYVDGGCAPAIGLPAAGVLAVGLQVLLGLTLIRPRRRR